MLTTLFIITFTFTAIGCESGITTGPANALIERELSDEALKMTKGIFNAKAKVIKRTAVSNDLVDIEVELTMIRTTAEVPAQMKARAILTKKIKGNSMIFTALQLPPGAELPAEIKTFTYKRFGDGWQKEG